MGKLQNEDFKTEAELTGAGGAASQLLNDSKIWLTGLSKTLDDAITAGDLSGSSAALTTFIKDVKATSTDGGTATSGSWQTRDLNTQTADTSFASVSSNQIVINAGTYDIEIIAPAFKVDSHCCKLRNITDSSDTIIGAIAYNDSATNVETNSVAMGRFTIASTKTFEVQHQVGTTKATNGWGIGNGFGVSSVFTQVKITKI